MCALCQIIVIMIIIMIIIIIIIIIVVIIGIIVIIITLKDTNRDYNYLTALPTVSNMYVQMAERNRVQSANHVQHIQRLSHGWEIAVILRNFH